MPGNTVTLAHYLDLLAGAGMVRGIPKFAGDVARSRPLAHLANAELRGECRVHYWRDRNHEVDFVVQAARDLTASK